MKITLLYTWILHFIFDTICKHPDQNDPEYSLFGPHTVPGQNHKMQSDVNLFWFIFEITRNGDIYYHILVVFAQEQRNGMWTQRALFKYEL